MQIWPAIDLLGGKCVRLQQGDYQRETVFADDPTEMADKWKQAGTKYLHLVDLDGAKDGSQVNGEVIRRIVAQTGLECQVGGGVRNEETIARLLGLGLSRVIVGTRALRATLANTDRPGWPSLPRNEKALVSRWKGG